MIIKAILFDINGTLIDINTDEGNEEIYRGISHILTYQGISMHRWEVRDEYYRIMDIQRKTGQDNGKRRRSRYNWCGQCNSRRCKLQCKWRPAQRRCHGTWLNPDNRRRGPNHR